MRSTIRIGLNKLSLPDGADVEQDLAAPIVVTPANARLEALTNDRLLQRNVLLNLIGWALPAVAALASIPLLARGLGPARFGLVALAWSSVSIFSLFDFGLGRALTRIVAERLAAHDDAHIGDSVWAATWVLVGLTGLLAVVGIIMAPTIVDRAMHVPLDVRTEAIASIRLISLAIPLLAHGVALRGVLEAGQQFRTVNQLRVPLGIATYVGPLIALPFGASASTAVGIVIAARAIYWIAHFFVLDRVAPRIAVPRIPSRDALHELATVGGWITVSNVVTPIMGQADRVAVATMFPIAASGWYGSASELAQKQALFTAALQPVLFSAVSASLKPAPSRAAELMERGSRVTLLVILPIAAILTAFAGPILKMWLGPAYAVDAAPVLRWLTVGMYVNAVAGIPYSILQGGVDARAPALLHLIELPLYVAAVFWLATTHGTQGVAVAWFVRMVLDSVALWAILYSRFRDARPAMLRVARLAVVCVVVLAIAAGSGAVFV